MGGTSTGMAQVSLSSIHGLLLPQYYCHRLLGGVHAQQQQFRAVEAWVSVTAHPKAGSTPFGVMAGAPEGSSSGASCWEGTGAPKPPAAPGPRLGALPGTATGAGALASCGVGAGASSTGVGPGASMGAGAGTNSSGPGTSTLGPGPGAKAGPGAGAGTGARSVPASMLNCQSCSGVPGPGCWT